MIAYIDWLSGRSYFTRAKVLLVREKDVGWWSFPGGGIDYGENISQAFPRELAEELGVLEADYKADYHIAYFNLGAVVNGVPRANLFYRVDVPYDRICAGNDVLEVRWFKPSELTSEITSRYTGPSASDAMEFMKAIEDQSAVIAQK